MKCFLFDLDDTLYPEITYVQSGFKAVAIFLSKNYLKHQTVEDVYQQIWEEFLVNRKFVFDRVLDKYGIDNNIINELIEIYRNHEPDIVGYEDISALKYYKENGLSLGLISDGFEFIQKKKISKLGLEGIFEVEIYTWDHGNDYAKPSILPFLKAVKNLSINPDKKSKIA